jgi:protein phosphatase
MASTVVVCALRYDRAAIAHVGDSRCYLIRNQKVRLITHDHTVAAEQLRLGLLSKQEAKEVPTRHVLSRSLGSGLFVKVEIDEFQLLPDDALLLCSDGLHGAVPDEEISATILRNKELEVATRELVDSANKQDGGDNVSIQLIRIRGVERMGMYRGRPYKLR